MTSTQGNKTRLAWAARGLAATAAAAGGCPCLSGRGGRRRRDEPPEITYCAVDAAGTLTLRAVTPDVPIPEQEELNKKFAELVVSLTLSVHLFSSLMRLAT